MKYQDYICPATQILNILLRIIFFVTKQHPNKPSHKGLNILLIFSLIKILPSPLFHGMNAVVTPTLCSEENITTEVRNCIPDCELGPGITAQLFFKSQEQCRCLYSWSLHCALCSLFLKSISHTKNHLFKIYAPH